MDASQVTEVLETPQEINTEETPEEEELKSKTGLAVKEVFKKAIELNLVNENPEDEKFAGHYLYIGLNQETQKDELKSIVNGSIIELDPC